MTQKSIKDLSFEEAMAELDRVVSQMDRGEVTLEQSITLYTRGKELQEHCEAKLKDAEAKIEKLTLDAKGAPTGTEPAEGM
jgi:exodeoxyribonuclease VII small subunit